MKRIIYSSLSVLTAIGTVFVAAKAEVFNREGKTSQASSSGEVVAPNSLLDEANSLAELPDALGDVGTFENSLPVPADGEGGSLTGLNSKAFLNDVEKPQKGLAKDGSELLSSSVEPSKVGPTEATSSASIIPITTSLNGTPQALPVRSVQARALPAQPVANQAPRREAVQVAQPVQTRQGPGLVAQVPDTTVPEATVPEATVPESTVPESTIPGTTPGTTLPETTPTAKPTSEPDVLDETEATAGDPDDPTAAPIEATGEAPGETPAVGSPASPTIVPSGIGTPLPTPGFSEPAISPTPVPANGDALVEEDALTEEDASVDAIDEAETVPEATDMPASDGIDASPEMSPADESVPLDAAPVGPEGIEDPGITPIAPPGDIEGTEEAPVAPEGEIEAPDAAPIAPEGEIEAPGAAPITPGGIEEPGIAPVAPPGDIEGPDAAPVAPPGGMEDPGITPVTPPGDIDGVEEAPVGPPGDVPGAPIEGMEEEPEGLDESDIEDNMPAGEDPPLDAPVPASPPTDIPSDVPPAGAPIPGPGAPVPGSPEGMPPGPTDEIPPSPAPSAPVEPLPPIEEDAIPGEPVPGPTGDSGDRLIGEGFTPFQLSYLAFSGGLDEEGIPGGTRLLSAYESGSLSAEDVVEAGAISRKLGTAASDEEDFTKSVDNFLKLMVRDNRTT
ncbi:MAG: hypothetical protein AAFP07_19010 [Cyanobacteria bacterium J06606_4]